MPNTDTKPDGRLTIVDDIGNIHSRTTPVGYYTAGGMENGLGGGVCSVVK